MGCSSAVNNGHLSFIYKLGQNDFLRTITDAVHAAHPSHLVGEQIVLEGADAVKEMLSGFVKGIRVFALFEEKSADHHGLHYGRHRSRICVFHRRLYAADNFCRVGRVYRPGLV
mgnify:CR=1 FL=1